MSEQKPKKDLRARLGRTIAPNTPGAPPIAAPGGIVPPSAAPVAAPAAAAPKAPSASGDIAAPAPVAAPVAAAPVAAPVIAPPIAAPAKMPFGNDIAPPPFAQPKAEPARPQSKRPDPFAAPAPQEVRVIAVDAKPVDDAEVGRSQGGRVFLVLGLALLVGAALGGGVGTMNARRRLYNTTVTDGHSIYAAVDTASRTVLQAQQHIEALATAAGGGTSGHPGVSYADIDALVALQEPLEASHFSQRNYNAFTPATVDDLFIYYGNIQELWRQFHDLRDITSGPAERPSVDAFAAIAVCPLSLQPDQTTARASIQAAADATATATTAEYVGSLVQGPDGTIRASLRFGEAAMDAQGQPTANVAMHVTPGDTATTAALWTQETAITTTPTHAILINGANSAGVLSERLGSFRSYVQALAATRQLMTNTIEVQGRLTTALGDIARLTEVPTLPF